jgi:hypothetical protein
MYTIIILPLVLYWCETWSLVLEEKRRLRVFENKVLRRIYGPKGDGVRGDRRKLHKEKFNDLYCTPNTFRAIKLRIMGWAELVVRMRKRKGVYRVVVGIPEGQKPIGRPGRRWKDIIKMDFQDVGYGGMEWIDLAQDRDRWQAFLNAVMNFRVP